MLRSGASFGRNHGNLGGRAVSRLTPSLRRPPVRLEAAKVEAGGPVVQHRFSMQTAGGPLPEWLN
ncbi:MAG TPA: hypothetical protein GX511_00635 [Firmicutes bacterium]|nr:hypothetical protein [Bacillota bacterium]